MNIPGGIYEYMYVCIYIYVCMYSCSMNILCSPVLHDVRKDDGHFFQLCQQGDVEVADSNAHHFPLRIRYCIT